MQVKRFADAQAYSAPNHDGCVSLRLAGFEPDGPTQAWTGCSHFLPGGGAGPDTSPLEKVYVVLSGQLTIKAQGRVELAGPMDTVFIPGGEEREIRNEGNEVVTMLVVMPYPEGVSPAGST